MDKILIVDDDKDILFSLKHLLRHYDFETFTVAEAEHLIEVINKICPDIILMDINLSGHDGRKICKELKNEKNITAPIVLFSADPAYVHSAKDYLADDFVYKPFEVVNLVSQLRSHL